MGSAKGHNKACDWWSVGVLLFEMLTGRLPFEGKNRQQLQRAIIHDRLRLPTFLSSAACNSIKALLNKDQKTRAGTAPGGSGLVTVQELPLFKGMNWAKLKRREIASPFLPDITGPSCTANFDTKWTKMEPKESPDSTPPTGESMPALDSPGGSAFAGYTYTRGGVGLLQH